MAAITLYYSLGGTTALIAREMAARDGADAEEIREVKKRGAFRAFFPGVFEARKGKASAILPLKVDFSRYDEVTIAAPVWAGQPAPAAQAAAEQIPAGKRVKILLVSGSGKGSDELIRRRIEARGSEVVEVIQVKGE